MNILRYVAAAVENHFGAIVASAFGIYLAIAYYRGELKPLLLFLKDMLSGPDGRASTKNTGYFIGTITLCWSFVKITLATCRRIDMPENNLDPTAVFMALLGVIATLVGGMYLGGKAIMAKVLNDKGKNQQEEGQL